MADNDFSFNDSDLGDLLTAVHKTGGGGVLSKAFSSAASECAKWQKFDGPTQQPQAGKLAL